MTTPSDHAAAADAVAYWRQFPVTWDPEEPGETVRGKVEHLGEAKTRDGDGDRWVPRVQIRTDSGQLVTVLASQKRLLAKLVKLKPRVGDPILIQYQGDDGRAAPGMSPTQRFFVAVRDEVGEKPK